MIKTLAALALCASHLAAAQTLTPSVESVSYTEDENVISRRAVSLKDALQLVAKNNPDLRAAIAQAAQVKAQTELVNSAVLPELSLNASYVHTTVEQKFDTSQITNGFIGAIQTVGPAYGLPTQANAAVLDAFRSQAATDPVVIVARNSIYGTLLMQQVLFSPQFFLLPAAKDAVEAARRGSLEAREQVLLAAARVYLGLEGIVQLEQAARDAETVALKRERDMTNQVRAGMTTEINVLRAQTETAQARATIATLAGNRIGLLALLEALAGEAIRPIDGEPTNFDVVAQASASQPWEQTWGLKASLLGVSVQERFNLVDNLAYLPNVVGQLKGSYNSNRGFAGTNWILDGVVALQWSLYDRGVRYANKHEHDAKLVQLKAQLESSRTKARANWISAKANIDAAKVALQQAESQSQLAARAQKQVESAFQSGVATALEVSDIDSKRFFAASSAAQARAQLEIRKVELAASEGRLATLAGLTSE